MRWVLWNYLEPQLRLIREDVLTVILSDHGFIYQLGRKTPYRHKGNNPFERIVPCAVFIPPVA